MLHILIFYNVTYLKLSNNVVSLHQKICYITFFEFLNLGLERWKFCFLMIHSLYYYLLIICFLLLFMFMFAWTRVETNMKKITILCLEFYQTC